MLKHLLISNKKFLKKIKMEKTMLCLYKITNIAFSQLYNIRDVVIS